MTAMPCAITSSIKILSKFHYNNVWKIDHSFRFQFAGKVRYPPWKFDVGIQSEQNK